MSINDNVKKPFKLLEIPVSKYKDEAIPHHLHLLGVHKEIIKKDCGDSNKMRVEVATIKRITAQLKNLLYELDTLRAQVEDSDLDKFDMKTVSIRKIILQILSEYADLQKQATASLTPSPKKQSRYTSEEKAISPELEQLQIDENIQDLKLKEKQATLQNVEAIQTDIQDLHSAYGTLHEMVADQQENVNTIEENVESAQINVTTGARHIATAARLKAAVYPVTGALVGTCIGGPIGLVAGIKIGSLAALSCGLLGYLGGSVLKKRKVNIPRSETVDNIVQENRDNSRAKKEE